jgi:ABC-type proline/glycine betaine transport system permease subunit
MVIHGISGGVIVILTCILIDRLTQSNTHRQG